MNSPSGDAATPAPPSPPEISARRILLVGNPNSGKTTLFNRLTGMRQRVGNFPGVTVERKTGILTLPHAEAEVTDLPGCYSLAPNSEDEQVVMDALLRPREVGGPHLVIGVVDATNLSRHLILMLQVIDLRIPLVIALNRWDMAAKSGLVINVPLLSERLGVPVVPVSATRGTGIQELAEAVHLRETSTRGLPALDWPPYVAELSQATAAAHAEQTGLSAAEWRRLFFTREHARYHEQMISRYNLEPVIKAGRGEIERHGMHPLAAETLILRRFTQQVLQDCINRPADPEPSTTRRLDMFLTHPVGGLAIFAAVMMAMFMLLFRASEPLVAGLEWVIDQVAGMVEGWVFLPAWLSSLLIDGLIAGAGGVLTFLPQIILLFLFIGLLEDSGYMSRAACVMDRWLSRCGLNGKSMVPMLSSFACAIPGIMATRTIEQPKTRLTTILVAPLISCSARLPVYTLLIGAIIAPKFGALAAGAVLFLIHILGLSLAFPAAWILNRKLFKAGTQPLILEMPAYSWPRPRDLFHRVYNSSRSFVRRAGTLIVMISLVIWALVYFPVPPGATDPGLIDSARMENSLLGRMGKVVQPIFAPAGYDWKISVGILASFPAREVIIATLSVLYQDRADEHAEETMPEAIRRATWASGPMAGQPVFTLPVAMSLLVFIALCMQCSATLITMARESRWKWALMAYGTYTLIAWLGAVLTYQLLR